MKDLEFSWQRTLLSAHRGRLECDANTMHCVHDVLPCISASEEVVGYTVHHIDPHAPLHVRKINGTTIHPSASTSFTCLRTGARCLRLEWDSLDLEMNADKVWTSEEMDYALGERFTTVFDQFSPHLSRVYRAGGREEGSVKIRYHDVQFPSVVVYVSETSK